MKIILIAFCDVPQKLSWLGQSAMIAPDPALTSAPALRRICTLNSI
jgi:hypothetical protein